MIKNERQYRVTRAQLRAFEESLRDVGSLNAPQDVEPEIFAATRDALSSQREELKADVEEYEALQRGEITQFVAESLGQLPPILIKARIARGLTQRELAERLGVKEQQVQRWEASEYENATIFTLKQVIEALGVETREELFIPNEKLTPQLFLQNMEVAGVSKSLLLRRLLPPRIAVLFEADGNFRAGLREMLDAASTISRVFGTRIGELLNAQPPQIALAVIAGTRFKLPARTKASTVNAYTVYAHYLAALVESCVEATSPNSLTSDCHAVHQALTGTGHSMTFESALHYFWQHNVIILPLRDEGGFHGAVWKIRDRFVIVLKQMTALESRWLYDLLHEAAHIVLEHVAGEVGLVEDQPISPDSEGKEEEDANEWAEDVIFDGDSSLIEDACVQASGGQLQRLNRIVPDVARQFNVNAGALANYMAYRLASQGENWWGSAHNLQTQGSDPFAIARDFLLLKLNLRKLNEFDRELLVRAMMED